MRLFRRLFDRIAAALMARASRRPPDFIVGGRDNPYLLRWYLTPWRRWHAQARNAVRPTLLLRARGWLGFVLPSVYLHKFLRDDDDRALHDHPWFWCSILLRGEYVEHTIRAGGIVRRSRRAAGSVRIASPWRAHRIELFPWWLGPDDIEMPPVSERIDQNLRAPCWTLFIIGPRLRNWGFHCPERGWVPWQRFTAADDPGAIGKGCDA